MYRGGHRGGHRGCVRRERDAEGQRPTRDGYTCRVDIGARDIRAHSPEDRTSGAAAVDDFASFVNAGIDTFDTGPEACGYGPSELIIGEALKSGKISRDGESILFYVRTGN